MSGILYEICGFWEGKFATFLKHSEVFEIFVWNWCIYSADFRSYFLFILNYTLASYFILIKYS